MAANAAGAALGGSARSDWYYLLGENRHGPAATDEMLVLVRQGIVRGDTLLWRAGGSAWQPAQQWPELAASFGAAAPVTQSPPSTAASTAAQRATSDPATAPLAPAVDQSALTTDPAAYGSSGAWSRFLAKLLDLWVFSAAIGFTVGWLAPGFAARAIRMPDAAWAFVLMPLAMLVEGFFIAALSTTPGKFLLGVRVTSSNGDRLWARHAVQRALWSWITGLGLGLPIVNLVTMWASYRGFRRTGTTTWDRGTGASVTQSRAGLPLRISAAALLVVAIVIFEGFARLLSRGTT